MDLLIFPSWSLWCHCVILSHRVLKVFSEKPPKGSGATAGESSRTSWRWALLCDGWIYFTYVYIYMYVYVCICIHTCSIYTHINVGLKDLPKSHQHFGGWLRVSLDPRRVVVRCLVQSQRTCGTALREGHWSLGGWITAPPKQNSEALDVMETQLILTNWNAGLFEGLELEGFRCYSLHGKKKKPRTVS